MSDMVTITITTEQAETLRGYLGQMLGEDKDMPSDDRHVLDVVYTQTLLGEED